ncbi:two-component sensor histidine kinase [Filimonas zeae]|uniref:sensor histidine kinase n=1 Tax=Filimonas zeae TaxID=1737353 RepID=UPI00166B750E|nr:sensor histidine kinase [Filimonas zeae]MDR6340652.1 two-component sensor histidine kinase [Filimonas zeae]
MKTITVLAAMLYCCLLPVKATAQATRDTKADSLLKVLAASRTDADRIRLYGELAEHHILKPDENKADIDKAEAYLYKADRLLAERPVQEAGAYLLLVKSYLAKEKHQLANGKALVLKALEMLKAGSDQLLLGRAYLGVADYYGFSEAEEAKEKIRWTELACQALARCADSIRYAGVVVNLAELYNVVGNNKQALTLLDQVIPLYHRHQYKRLSGVYMVYGSVYEELNDDKKALSYFLLALKEARAANDTSFVLCQMNNRIGSLMINAREFESGIPYLLEALRIALKFKDANAVLTVLYNCVNAYVFLNKPEDALNLLRSLPQQYVTAPPKECVAIVPFCYMYVYARMKNYALAEQYAGRVAVLIETAAVSLHEKANCYSILFRIYLAQQKLDQASLYMKKMDSAAHVTGDREYAKTVTHMQFRLDTAQSRYQQALVNLIKYHKISDSLYTLENKKQLSELQLTYETEKSKNEIKLRDQDILMLNQKNQLQKSTLEKATLIRNITATGVVILTALLALVYHLFRLKQNRNKTIETQNTQLQRLVSEKEWLVKEVHHRVKNHFHMVSSLLELQSSYSGDNQNPVSMAIRESQSRIQSMSLVHQKLYQSEESSDIYMPEYIYELMDYLRDSYGIRNQVRFALDIEKISLHHRFAVNIGLIINEAITNAIKYAFPASNEALIRIALKVEGGSDLVLEIADNGTGMSPVLPGSSGAGMGMDLLKGLTEDMGGQLHITANDGMHIHISFQLPQ